ncbi:hypothetical protein FH972_003035 [Carpinus fangiana]|uniref:PHD finger protein ALFIN-LIKE n=1 Tax=Carpinus fangiana TaxID=176857 RepID=A0A5N6QHA1_9ROSI|nr:hypothetical protein FH972_003035 [Carpinus fangiana]
MFISSYIAVSYSIRMLTLNISYANPMFRRCMCLEKENLCLYGFPNEQWEVNLPAEEVPPELPEPALGINFARDGMQEKDWLSLVAVHSDAWLLAVAFYFGARFGFDKADRKRLFSMINDLPTIFEVVTGSTKKQPKEKSVSNHSSNKSKSGSKGANVSSYILCLAFMFSRCSSHVTTVSYFPLLGLGHNLIQLLFVICSMRDLCLIYNPRLNNYFIAIPFSAALLFLLFDKKKKKNSEEDWNLATCGENYAADEFWICCDICEKWFHGKCVKITPARAEHIKQYKCPSCSNKRARP